MAVTPLENGEVITKADIQAAYGDVRTVVNAMPQENIGRLSLGQQHVATLLNKNTASADTPYDSAEVDDAVAVSTNTKTPESVTDIQTSWQRLQDLVPAWRLSNGGLGYSMRPGKVLAWASLRVSQFNLNTQDGRQNTWFALTWRADADVADQVIRADTRFCFCDDSNTVSGRRREVTEDAGAAAGTRSKLTVTYTEVSSSHARLVEHNLMLWTLIDKSAAAGPWTLQRLEVKAANCRGASNSPANALRATVASGTIGFIGFNDR